MVEADRLMEAQGVKRLPVVDEADRLLGVVSRGDLLRIFLRRDEAIREDLTGDLLRDTLGLDARDVTAEVTGGRVTVTGTVGNWSLTRYGGATRDIRCCAGCRRYGAGSLLPDQGRRL